MTTTSATIAGHFANRHTVSAVSLTPIDLPSAPTISR